MQENIYKLLRKLLVDTIILTSYNSPNQRFCDVKLPYIINGWEEEKQISICETASLHSPWSHKMSAIAHKDVH